MRTQRALFNGLFVLFMTFIACSSVWAVSYDIKEMTPEVKAALDARRARFEQLTALKSQGKIGETNRGYVEALSKDAETDAVAKAENADRATIYNTIINQNGLSADTCSTVEKVFAQVQRDKAAPGDSIQDESGQWIKK